ncbi:hypothetical protein MMC22_009051 [Lobaria immixta]|nr:hypothetical protein [Lobaria immixta]
MSDAEAIAVSAVLPSVPERVVQEAGFTNDNYGSGTQYHAQGEYVAQGTARQYNSAGAMYFGSIENEAEACSRALFLTDPRDDREQLIQAKGSRVDGTCEWIKSNKLYDSWLHSHSQLLWLSGGPGKGKTMLSIFLAEELERTVKHSQDILFLQYFCDNKDEKRRTAMTIIRGLIFQLLRSRQKLFSHILPSFKIQKESLFASSSFEALWRIFESMVHDPILGTAYCVLDGLDECDEASLEVLLRKFAALFSGKTNESSVCHLNLIIVSRDLPDFIPDLLSQFPRIRLDPDADTEINNDIYRFIEIKVDELSELRHYPEPLRVHVKEVFQKRAQGTFLWVGIVTKALTKYGATEVEEALDLFPQGLDELYARMLLQIDIDRREVAAKILRWVVMAVRPLTLSELSVALDITVEPSAVFRFRRDEVMRNKVSYCGYFLTIKQDKVSLIHQSAKDYLLRKSHDSNPKLELFRVQERPVNLEIARKCLNYLQHGALAAGKVNLRTATSHLEAFPLLSYAAVHWPEHARSLDPSEDIFDLSLSFYSKKSQTRESWLETYWAVERYGVPPKSFTLLHVASCFGILPLAENLLLNKNWFKKRKHKLYLNRMDGSQRTALMWAVEGGHKGIVRLLLEEGADFKAKGEYGQTALMWAAKKGHEAVVRLLLEKGANIEAKDEDGRTALMSAIMERHEAVVRLLLENRANIEANDKNGNTALMRAAFTKNEAVVRLLLENRANIEAKDGHGQTALMKAATRRHEAVVRLLLENRANIEAKDKDGWTALMSAAMHGQEAVVRLLLENRANMEARDEDGKTALMWAARGDPKAVMRVAQSGHEAVVRLLLENRASTEAKDAHGQTALMWAAMEGHEAVVRLLLESRANIEARGEVGQTALIWAAYKEHEAVVRLLLENKANIEAKYVDGSTALMMVAWRGREAVVRLLLENKANIEANDKYGETALILAAIKGNEAVVRLLLENRANIEAKSENGRTALMRAAMEGHEAVVRLLLENRANIEAKDEHGRTALMRAAMEGHEAVVRLLLEYKANIEAKDEGGQTALMWAAMLQRKAVVRLLKSRRQV